VSAAPEILEVMPEVSRALKNQDTRRALRLLEPVVGARVARRAVTELVGGDVSIPVWTDPLTRAQWACLWNVACGLRGREAARRFNRAADTINRNRDDAMARLGAHTQAGAVAEAYRRGIFDVDRPLEPVDW
jgi:DNA-binding NarL/FixJ family response regulator